VQFWEPFSVFVPLDSRIEISAREGQYDLGSNQLLGGEQPSVYSYISGIVRSSPPNPGTRPCRDHRDVLLGCGGSNYAGQPDLFFLAWALGVLGSSKPSIFIGTLAMIWVSITSVNSSVQHPRKIAGQ
jgi:hypothetical protein